MTQVETETPPVGNGHPPYDQLIDTFEKWRHLEVETYKDNQSRLMSVGFNAGLDKVLDYLKNPTRPEVIDLIKDSTKEEE